MADPIVDPRLTLVRPIVPDPPKLTDTWDKWDVYLRAIQLNNAATHTIQIYAQALAMDKQATAIDRTAAAQEQTVAALNAPPPAYAYTLPSEAQLVEALVRNNVPLTNARSAARAFLAAYKPPIVFQP